MNSRSLANKKRMRFFKILIFTLVVACAFGGLRIVANAASVKADRYEIRSLNTNSQTVKVNETASFTGQVTYDAATWIIPFWATCYFYLDVPYMPFQQPTLSDGSTKLKYVGNSDISGTPTWQYYTSFTTFGKTIKSASATAKAEGWTDSGKGGVGSGKGHDWDSNKVVTITTAK